MRSVFKCTITWHKGAITFQRGVGAELGIVSLLNTYESIACTSQWRMFCDNFKP